MVPVLRDIIEHKKVEVANLKARISPARLRAQAEAASAPRSFDRALLADINSTAVIAEIKRQSPSAGLIRPEYARPEFAPEDIARRYHAAGARAISCLTDEQFFGGHLSFLERVRRAIPLPVLRKDFIIDATQIDESRAAGADAILLIAECLDDSQLADFTHHARSLGLGVLMEIHDEPNLARVLPHVQRGVFLGVNNRDLSTMKVDLQHCVRMAAKVGPAASIVGESGIRTPEDLRTLRSGGVRIVLVGEHLMRQDDPGAALQALLETPR